MELRTPATESTATAQVRPTEKNFGYVISSFISEKVMPA